jgi:hypothetical protein
VLPSAELTRPVRVAALLSTELVPVSTVSNLVVTPVRSAPPVWVSRLPSREVKVVVLLSFTPTRDVSEAVFDVRVVVRVWRFEVLLTIDPTPPWASSCSAVLTAVTRLETLLLGVVTLELNVLTTLPRLSTSVGKLTDWSSVSAVCRRVSSATVPVRVVSSSSTQPLGASFHASSGVVARLEAPWVLVYESVNLVLSPAAEVTSTNPLCKVVAAVL